MSKERPLGSVSSKENPVGGQSAAQKVWLGLVKQARQKYNRVVEIGSSEIIFTDKYGYRYKANSYDNCPFCRKVGKRGEQYSCAQCVISRIGYGVGQNDKCAEILKSAINQQSVRPIMQVLKEAESWINRNL